MIEIVTIDTQSLGDRGYLATDGTAALVIDAQRDFDRVLDAAADHGVTITHVFETHIHNDYLTGGLALARSVGAGYHVSAADQVSFDRVPVADGDVVKAGTMTVRVLETPGHTFSHLSYALSDGDRVIAAFTGGCLLSGSTGRTDLLGAQHSERLAHAQYRSARRLAGELPDAAALCPTHGFGSFCAAGPPASGDTTIGAQKRANPVLTSDEASYVRDLLASLDAYPAYYAHMGAANAAGPAAPDLSPPRRADAAELRHRIDAGEWVVDLRTRTAFAAGHLRGALHFELGDSFATYLGWLIPWQAPLTLIGETPRDVAQAQRDLVRIGIDRLAGAATGPAADWAGAEPLESYPAADFAALARARAHGPLVLVDVRQRGEWDAGHIDGAVHIPLPELPGRIGEIPAGPVWVHCQSGYRSSTAASLLAAAGRPVTQVNDEFDRAAGSGLPVTAAAPGRP